MKPQLTYLWIVGGYFLAFLWLVLGLFVWKAKRKGGRLPVDFKLLRGPGESLRRRVAVFEEDFMFKMGLAALIPIAGLAPGFLLLNVWKPQSWAEFGAWAGLTFLVFIGSCWLGLRWALAMFTRNRADRLGYLGEREVGERLMPLLASGYKVFHDVPADGAKGPFNLDHVAIGPTGVAVVETKTRRKGKRRPDDSDYRVRYDGQKLQWPWGADTETITQALAVSDWAREFIQQRTRLTPPVKTIVTIPGWWVDACPGPVLVVNSKSIASAVVGRGPEVLSNEQIELIAAQFEERCRDVVD